MIMASSPAGEALSPPTISVVICTRNRPDSLARCVSSVLDQRLLPLELIVVDDGQTDSPSRQAFEQQCTRLAVRFIYLQKQHPGLPASRNLAVRHARGDVVQFLDDDVELDGDFLRQIARIYSLDPNHVVVGTEGTLFEPAPPGLGSIVFAWLYAFAGWWALPPKKCHRKPLPAALADERWAFPMMRIAGATMAFRREVLNTESFDEGLGGYALGEDRDMAWRVSRCGRVMRVRAASAVHHHDPASRPDPFQFGRMTVLNYTRIMRRVGRNQIGDRIVMAYSLLVITLCLAIFSMIKPRRYACELQGILSGICELATGRGRTCLNPQLSTVDSSC